MTEVENKKNGLYFAVSQVKNGFMLKHEVEEGSGWSDGESDYYIASDFDGILAVAKELYAAQGA